MSSLEKAAAVSQVLKDLPDDEVLKILRLVALDRGLNLDLSPPLALKPKAKKAKKTSPTPLEEKVEVLAPSFDQVDLSFMGETRSVEQVQALEPVHLKEFHKGLSKARVKLLKKLKQTNGEGCPDDLKIVFDLFPASLDAWIKAKGRGSFPVAGSL